MKFLKILLFPFLLFTEISFSYDLPYVNLGLTNILDGGPVRPVRGSYLYEYAQYYQANKFLNSKGKLLDGVPSPKFSIWAIANNFVYQFDKNKLFNAAPGLEVFISYLMFSNIKKNQLNITTSGNGFSDLYTGIYLQWDMIKKKNNDPFFVNRLQFAASFPVGKYSGNKTTILNPGNNLFYINPYWAASLYFTSHFAISWRLHYLWSSENKKTHIKPGDAIHLNYSIEYEPISSFWIGINGYFLQQIQNSKLCNKDIPNSRERVLAVGPGAAYFYSKDLVFFTHLYFETLVRNRTQGINFILRFVKHF